MAPDPNPYRAQRNVDHGTIELGKSKQGKGYRMLKRVAILGLYWDNGSEHGSII